MPWSFDISERVRDGVAIIGLTGQFVGDEGDRALLERVLALEAQGVRQFLIDLHAISYIDSGGVGSLVATYLHVVRRGGQLKLLSPSNRAVRVLEMTHVGAIFEIFADEAKALATFPHTAGKTRS